MMLELAAAGFLIGQYIYHRWFDEEPPRPGPDKEITVPRTDDGATIPLLYGRCLVRAPVLACVLGPTSGLVTPPGPSGAYNTLDLARYGYAASFFFVLGIPFTQGTNRLHRIFVGDRNLELMPGQHSHLGVPASNVSDLSELTGEGNNEEDTRIAWLGTPTGTPGSPLTTARSDPTNMWIEGVVEFLDGRFDQLLVDPTSGTPLTRAGKDMIDNGIPANEIPGYRGYMSAFLHGGTDIGLYPWSSDDYWHVGFNSKIDTYSFECSTYPVGKLQTLPDWIGNQDVNPADVLFDIFTATFAKLGIPFQYLDIPSFVAMANTLVQEEHGYSRAFEDQMEAKDMVREIMEQIDGVWYEDPVDGKIKVRLIRGDYDVASLPVIDPDNCDKIENFAAGSWVNIVNKVRLVYYDRQQVPQYTERSVAAQNMANAVGQDGQVREAVVRYRGCMVNKQAIKHAARELSARSRPITKCTVYVDRSFYRTVVGDVVSLLWPEYGIDRMVMRVANVDRDALLGNYIKLDLIQDQFADGGGQPVSGAYTLDSFPNVFAP